MTFLVVTLNFQRRQPWAIGNHIYLIAGNIRNGIDRLDSEKLPQAMMANTIKPTNNLLRTLNTISLSIIF
jgi:hypothetical protein